jgi:hypothetical protein
MLQGLLQRMSLTGKLMCGGALASIIASFLNSYSVHGSSPVGGVTISKGTMMLESGWRGIVPLVGCVACGILALLTFGDKPNLKQKQFTIAALAASVIALLVTILLFTKVSDASSAFSGFGGQFGFSTGFGLYLMLLASIACVAGSVMQARAVKVF